MFFLGASVGLNLFYASQIFPTFFQAAVLVSVFAAHPLWEECLQLALFSQRRVLQLLLLTVAGRNTVILVRFSNFLKLFWVSAFLLKELSLGWNVLLRTFLQQDWVEAFKIRISESLCRNNLLFWHLKRIVLFRKSFYRRLSLNSQIKAILWLMMLGNVINKEYVRFFKVRYINVLFQVLVCLFQDSVVLFWFTFLRHSVSQCTVGCPGTSRDLSA